MSALGLRAQERRNWSLAAAVACAAHVLAAAALVIWQRPAAPQVPEPVVLVELPEQAGSQAAPAVAQAQPQPAVSSQTPQARLPTPPVAVPSVRAPLPDNPVTLPQPAPNRTPVAAAPTMAPEPPAVASVGSGSGTSPLLGSDQRAKKAEVDYFSLVSAYLNRRKVYPAEARKAREEGVVTIRFTVDRGGNVSAASIKRSSGHALLDQATLALLQRVAPLPRMPDAMARQTVTLALPIEYSLRTS